MTCFTKVPDNQNEFKDPHNQASGDNCPEERNLPKVKRLAFNDHFGEKHGTVLRMHDSDHYQTVPLPEISR